jgi:hypothetical protein
MELASTNLFLSVMTHCACACACVCMCVCVCFQESSLWIKQKGSLKIHQKVIFFYLMRLQELTLSQGW